MKHGSGVFLLIFLWCASLGLMLSRGGYASFFLCAALGLLTVYSICVKLFTFRRVQVVRHLSETRMRAGEDLVVSVTVRQHSWIPLAWMIIQDEWMNPGREQRFHHRKLIIPWFRSTFTYQYKINRIPRGEYAFLGFDLVTGDLFGITAKMKRLDLHESFIMHPQPMYVRNAASTHHAGEGRSVIQRIVEQDSALVSSVRDYAHGDAMNRIHWKASSRLGALKTKETDPSRSNSIAVVLDACLLSYSKPDGPSAFETCVQVAAGLIYYGQEHQSKMGLYCTGTTIQAIPLAGRIDIREAYDMLARLNPDGAMPLYDAINKETTELPLTALIVFITANLDDALIRTVLEMRRRRFGVTVVHVQGTASPVLTNHDRQWKRQLESAGCAFISLRSHLSETSGKGEAADVGA